MNSTMLALRAITAVFFRRMVRFIGTVVAVILILLCALITYLSTTVSGWWAILFIVLVPLGLATFLVATVVWGATTRIMPKKLTATETRRIHDFTGKLFGLVEAAKMPYPVKVGLIAKDVLRGRESTFLRNAIQDSRSLKGEFDSIKTMF